ncbi:MAG: glycosyltransferase family 4 protein [Lentimicrobiaceae bacterium]|nr:glycosyltransferase family 4 protein [Lentimicrobiaceae bacterium]
MVCDYFHESQQYQENLLAKYYLKLGHNVTVVASTTTSVFEYYSRLNRDEKERSEYFVNGIKVIRQPYSVNIFNRVRKLKGLKKIINEESPDLIYLHGVPLNLPPAVAYKNKKKCKIVFDYHADYSNSANNWFSIQFLHKVLYRSVLRAFLKKIDRIFYVTPEGGKFLNELYGIPYNLMDLLPLGVDVDYINELRKNPQALQIRKNLGIQDDDFAIFTGGKLTRAKKIDLVIESFLLLDHPGSHLIIVGDTKDEEYKSKLLKQINNHPGIHFIGWIPGQKVYDYMSACNVAVFPASQSVMWQQAIGSGLPLIVGQSVGQDATYLNKNNNIFLIEEAQVNKENIVRLLKLLIEDENLLKVASMNALKTSNEFLSYEIIAKTSVGHVDNSVDKN